MLKERDSILVAVSGGPDSVCLLLSLLELRRKLKLKLSIAHLNHGFRPVAGAKDAEYVRRLAKKHRLPYIYEKRNVPAIVKKSPAKRGSPEEIARDVRYEFLLRTAARIGANKIALGHTQDDQAETVLMRLLRGTGLRGLRGMPGMREITALQTYEVCNYKPRRFVIIRPLIEVSREEVLGYLRGKRVKARVDASNRKTVYRRNKIQLELIPRLEKEYNVKIKQVLANMAQGLSADFEWLSRESEREFKACAKVSKKGELALSLAKLDKYPEAIKRQVLRRAVEKTKGDLNKIDYRHWRFLDELISDERDIGIDLPQGLRAEKRKRRLVFFMKF